MLVSKRDYYYQIPFSCLQNLCTEIEGHEPLITAVVERGDKMVHEDHPMAEKVELLKESMQLRWDNLKQLSQGHEEKLGESLKAKQVRKVVFYAGMSFEFLQVRGMP